jgi:hypothetical protein
MQYKKVDKVQMRSNPKCNVSLTEHFTIYIHQKY